MEIFDYDNILLLPRKCRVESRSECDASVELGGRSFRVPVVPANMKTVVDERICTWMAQNGYFYVMHRFDLDNIQFVKDMHGKGCYASISLGVKQPDYDTVAQRVAWATPDLDMTLQGRPVNSRAIEVFDREQATSRAQSLTDLARTHVLFFFFRSDCPYCHAFAPTLEAFNARFGIQVVPISVDGKGLPNFPTFRRDNGIARTLQVTQVPAIYLAEPYTGKITPIGFGVLSESQLIERIATVAAPGADAYAPSITKRVNLQ